VPCLLPCRARKRVPRRRLRLSVAPTSGIGFDETRGVIELDILVLGKYLADSSRCTVRADCGEYFMAQQASSCDCLGLPSLAQ